MTDAVIVVLLLAAIYVALPVVLLMFRDWYIKPTRGQISQVQIDFRKRLHSPDFASLEDHYGCSFPSCVKELYANEDELLREEFEVVEFDSDVDERCWYVAFYQPADLTTVRDMWPGHDTCFAFANDGCGNEYLINPTDTDPAVQFYDHETDELYAVSDRFTEFMTWKRMLSKE